MDSSSNEAKGQKSYIANQHTLETLTQGNLITNNKFWQVFKNNMT